MAKRTRTKEEIIDETKLTKRDWAEIVRDLGKNEKITEAFFTGPKAKKLLESIDSKDPDAVMIGMQFIRALKGDGQAFDKLYKVAYGDKNAQSATESLFSGGNITINVVETREEAQKIQKRLEEQA
jgi:hypothetical protein